MLEQRNLGGLTVSELGLGCMGMSFAYGPGDDDESIRTIHRALELGVLFLDTADMYGAGANEELVGRAVAGRREDFVIATKFANRTDADGNRFIDNSPAWIRQAVDDSLRRLGTDYIDLYYMHRRDPDVPIEETVGAMAELVQAGKVRHLGLSEVSAETLRAAPRCTRSPRCRASGRCSRAGSRRRSCRPRASSASAWCRTRRSAAGSSPARSRARSPRAGRLPPPEPALDGREPRAQPGARAAVRDLAEQVGLLTRAARAGLAARPGRRRRPDPRHQARQVPGGEHGGGGRRDPAEVLAQLDGLGEAAGDRYQGAMMQAVER